MRSIRTFVTAALVVLSFGGMSVSAQTPIYGAAGDTASRPTAGWTLTPSFSYAGTWDDNVLLMTTVNPTILGGYTDTLFPGAQLEFLSRRTQFSAGYQGSLINYRDLSTINSVDHRATLRVSRRVSRRVTFVGSGDGGTAPTTELLGVLAVPYVRIGSRMVEGTGGVQIAFTKRTSLTASYTMQWVDFDQDPIFGVDLLGGLRRGTDVAFRHSLSRDVAVTADYDLQQGTIVGNTHFNIQNGDTGVAFERHSLRITGAFGISRLLIPEMGLARTGPSWRAAFNKRVGGGSVDASYSRSFVPSYSFGGTSQNESFAAGASIPLARRVYTRSGFSVWRNQPILLGGLPLTSNSLDASVGYVLRPWLQLEGFFGRSHQNIDRPGGELNRDRVGFQIITAKPMRVR